MITCPDISAGLDLIQEGNGSPSRVIKNESKKKLRKLVNKRRQRFRRNSTGSNMLE
jgi:hypothetical protein